MSTLQLVGQTTSDVVTRRFVLPRDPQVRTAHLVGDFNNWDKKATPLELIEGVWQVEIKLPAGSKFHYRFLINGTAWHLDQLADSHAVHPYGGENSVVIT